MQIVIDLPNSIYANLSKIRRGSIASKRILDCVKVGKRLKDIQHTIELEADYQDENVNADIAKGMYKALNMLSQHLSGEDKTDADSD